MRYLNKTVYTFLIAAATLIGCNNSDDVVTENATEGAFLSIAGSSGALAGSPEAGVDLADAVVEFAVSDITYSAAVTDGAGDVKELIVRKTYDGQTVDVASTTESEIEVNYSSIEEVLSGFTGVTSEDLRIGDVITFQTFIIMNDGRELVNSTAALNVQVSCVADLSGTYTVTNSGCNNANFPFTVTITKNSDGSYHLTSADGGFLHRCTANSTLINAGNIVEQCGEILPSGDLDFGPDNSPYDIGIIVGGTWDAVTGTLTMEHEQSFTANWPSSWTSTYVRQ